MHVSFITGSYPSLNLPSDGTFVQQFAWAMARQGNDCSVIKPTSIFARRHGPFPPRLEVQDAGGGCKVTVHRPLFLSFSSKDLGWTHTGRWSQRSSTVVAAATVASMARKPDLVYGHFLYPAGYAALQIGRSLGCPTVVGVGEDHLWTLAAYGEEVARRHYVTGGFFLANSTPNRDLLIDHLGIEPGRILMEPNGVDPDLMHPRERELMQRKHGIPGGCFTVACVGALEERKGQGRVLEAIEGIPDVQCIFAGTGTHSLESSRIVRKGLYGHSEIPELLSCADVFVLPTTSDGSCNAAIEAMACGLPIVTSNGKYMDDIVDNDVAIRVAPADIRAIRKAIVALKSDHDRRQRMSQACLNRARRFDINKRARRVTEWMEELVMKHRS